MGVRGVTDLMVLPGLVNLDYADIRSVMAEMGKAMMGTGEAEGEDRAMRAAEAAISNPLLEDTNMRGARGLLINITGGSDLTLFELDQAANRICEEVDKEANIMVGMALDESLAGRMRVSVVATGIDSAPPQTSHMPKLQVVNGAEPVSFPPQAAAQHSAHYNAGNMQQAAVPHAGAGYVPQPPDRPLVSAAYRHGEPNPDLHEAEMLPAAVARPMQPAQAPQPQAQAAPMMRHAMPEPARPPAEAPRRGNLFKAMFGFGGAPAQPPAQPQRQHQEPVMAPPSFRQEPMPPETLREPVRGHVRPAQIDEIALEIPAFLRRSGN